MDSTVNAQDLKEYKVITFFYVHVMIIQYPSMGGTISWRCKVRIEVHVLLYKPSLPCGVPSSVQKFSR